MVALNGFENTDWNQIALGDTTGEGVLVFPAMDTWWGRIDRGGEDRSSGLSSVNVNIRTLDEFPIEARSCLVKIDVEDAEINVLRGGRKFLRECCSFIVFESNQTTGRDALFEELSSLSFTIEALPLRDISHSVPLGQDAFIASKGENFLARKGLFRRHFS